MTAPRARSALVSLVIAAAVACGGSDKPGGPGESFRIAAIPPTKSTSLGIRTTLAINVVSTSYAGPLTVTATGAPASWLVEFPAPAISIAAGENINIIVNVTVPSNGPAAPSGQTLTFQVTGGDVVKTVTAQLNVANEYVLAIPAGTGADGAHWTRAYSSPLLLKSGVTLVIRNDDIIPHRVHTNASITGFPHQLVDMEPGSSVSYVMGDGSDVIYCHNHLPSTGELTITMQ